MPKKMQLHPHLGPQELERLYRDAKDPVERSLYQIVWLICPGKPTTEVMGVTGYSRTWIQEISRRYNGGGARALGDRRDHNPGAKDRALLDLDQ